MSDVVSILQMNTQVYSMTTKTENINNGQCDFSTTLPAVSCDGAFYFFFFRTDCTAMLDDSTSSEDKCILCTQFSMYPNIPAGVNPSTSLLVTYLSSREFLTSCGRFFVNNDDGTFLDEITVALAPIGRDPASSSFSIIRTVYDHSLTQHSFDNFHYPMLMKC